MIKYHIVENKQSNIHHTDFSEVNVSPIDIFMNNFQNLICNEKMLIHPSYNWRWIIDVIFERNLMFEVHFTKILQILKAAYWTK